MKIAIKIPKEFESDFTTDKFKECFDRVIVELKDTYKTVCGNYEMETLEMLKGAFQSASIIGV